MNLVARNLVALKRITTDKLNERIDYISLYVNLHTEFNLARYQATLFVEFRLRKTRTTYDKTRLYYVYIIDITTKKRHNGSIVCSTKPKQCGSKSRVKKNC